VTRLRSALAVIAVVGGLLALAAAFRAGTCDCGESGLPYADIAAWSGAMAVGAIVALAFVTALNR